MSRTCSPLDMPNGLGRGYSLSPASAARRQPSVKRAVTFVDGQNLFHAARASFGYSYPNYDVLALSRAVCRTAGWTLTDVRFYTGIPDPSSRMLSGTISGLRSYRSWDVRA